MSGLLDEIKQHDMRAKNKCAIRRILDTLSPEDAKDLERALADETYSGGAIARALNARGIDINPNGERVRIHRRGQCGCARG